MIDPGLIAPIQLAAAAGPEWVDTLSDDEVIALYHGIEFLRRPAQVIAPHGWRSWGFLAGRGFGKSFTIARFINDEVEAGRARSPAFMAPTEDRVMEVQVQFLIAESSPAFRPEFRNGCVQWPNGVRGNLFTPIAPERPRSENADLSWLCEVVDWQATTRRAAFDNITTATRAGPHPRYVWDTTSKGTNDVIQYLLAEHKRSPMAHRLTRGAMYDNPMLTKGYLESEVAKYTGRRYDEEVLGLSFQEAEGALFEQAWIDRSRVFEAPPLVMKLFALDPAQSVHAQADETGLAIGGLTRDGKALMLEDKSGRLRPEEWGDLTIRACLDGGCLGGIIERNHLGDNATFVLRARATVRGATVRTLCESDPWPTQRTPGVIYVRDHYTGSSKDTRARGPASAMELGRVRMLGVFPELEGELTTWVPGTRRSPNRLDAFAYLIAELLGLPRAVLGAQRGDHVAAATAAGALRDRLREMGKRVRR